MSSIHNNLIKRRLLFKSTLSPINSLQSRRVTLKTLTFNFTFYVVVEQECGRFFKLLLLFLLSDTQDSVVR